MSKAGKQPGAPGPAPAPVVTSAAPPAATTTPAPTAVPVASSVIQGAQLYYVFSFAFSSLPLREDIACAQGRKPLGRFLVEKLTQTRADHYVSVEWHRSEEKEPAESRAALYLPFHHLSLSTGEETVVLDVLGRAKKSAHIAVFESGMGVMWLLIEPDTAPDSDALARAANRGSFPTVSAVDGRTGIAMQPKTLHQVFYDQVAGLHQTINDAMADLDAATHATLRERFLYTPTFSEVAGEAPAADSPANRFFSVTWIDADEDLLWHDDTDRQDGRGAFEEPSTAVILKVAEDFRDAVDPSSEPTKEQRRNEAARVISHLLHTTSSEDLDPSHALECAGESLRNLYPDRRFRTFLHGNCLLVLHSEQMPSPPFKSFTSGLFRTFCALRGCWHVYTVVNEQLDRTIVRLLSQVVARTKQAVTSDTDLLEKQHEIILAKGRFLVTLATEDPFVRGVGLTPFGPLYQVGSEILRLLELRRTVEYKLNELDRLFDMVSSFRLRSKFAISAAGRTPLQRLFLVAGVCLLLVPVFFSPYLATVFTSAPIWVTVNAGLLLAGGACLIPWNNLKRNRQRVS